MKTTGITKRKFKANIQRVRALVDGIRAHQLHLVRSKTEEQMPPELRSRRDALENQLAQLRETKSQLDEDDYYQQLLPIMVELAKIYEAADSQ